ncbi:hypothetical protein [Acidimangrovimonas pyrenivorans]|uniref:Uncharacterized protein n=1 Tax=Acidimangrovimonas pyrenivorans TaxID=2030798 RepID=A0ABV7ALU2_9RHOB
MSKKTAEVILKGRPLPAETPKNDVTLREPPKEKETDWAHLRHTQYATYA